MKMDIPCHKCLGTEVRYGDCGYTTFNPGAMECTNCGFTVEGFVSGCSSPLSDFKRMWKKANTEITVSSLDHLKMLIDAGVEIKSCKADFSMEDLKGLLQLHEDILECHKVLNTINGRKSSSQSSTGLIRRLRALKSRIQ